MSLDISPETEARLAAKAKEQGLSVDAYLERQMDPPKGVQVWASCRLGQSSFEEKGSWGLLAWRCGEPGA